MKRFWLTVFLVILIACQPVTPVPTAIEQVEVTPVSSPAVPIEYELKQPDAKDLLQMIDAVLLTEKEWDPSVDELNISASDEVVLYFLIGHDFERYYLNGFPDADDLIVKDILPWEQGSWRGLGGFSTVLRIALLEYINKHQAVLESGMLFELPNANIKTFSMDIDGDDDLEWLVGAEYPDYSLLNWLLMDKQADGMYHLLPSFEYDWTITIESFPDIIVSDLTGDGIPEISKISYSYLAGRVSGIIKVFAWREDQLVEIEAIRLPGSPPVYYGISEYVIADLNADGITEVHVDSPQFRRFGCEWTKSSVYYLDGRDPAVDVTGEEIPNTDECLIAKALASNIPKERIELYQEAISKFSLEKTSLDELAWLRLHLSMAYVAIGDDSNADAQIEILNSMEGDGKFLEYIKNVYASSVNLSPLSFCDALYTSIASQIIPDRIGSDIDADLTHWAYPVDVAPLADLICPFPEVFANRLDTLNIPITTSPVDALALQGYNLDWTQSLDWDDDSFQEWLGVFQFNQPILVLMDGDNSWKMETLELYGSHELSDFETAIYQPDREVEKKVLILFTSDYKFCDSPETGKKLIEIIPGTLEYDSWTTCDSVQYSLKTDADVEFALDEFSQSYSYVIEDAPDWYYLPEFLENTYQQKTILDVVSELEDKVINQTDATEVASELSDLIDSLPVDDLDARKLFPRLCFLRGLNYELSGKKELAVAEYNELIERFPDSLWSRYAQIRLQPVK